MSVAREQPQVRRTDWRWIAAIAAVVLLGLGTWAFIATRPKPTTVVRRDIVAGVPLEGKIVVPPTERADIMPPYQAPVAKVYTSIGANVNRGETLVELSLPNVQNIYEEARTRVREAETAYANAKVTYGADLKAAQQRLSQARAAEKAATTTPAVQVAPTEGGTAVTIQEPAVDTTQATQARIAAEQDVANAQATLNAALIPYQQQLEAAREAFKDAQSGRKMALVRSPISGTVLALNAQAGQEVGKDRKVPVATVVDLDELELHADLKAEHVSSAKAGTPVTLTIKEIPNETFEGTVKSVTTEVSGPLKQQKYVAIVSIENRKGLVKPGMESEAIARAGEVKDVLAVPVEALQNDDTGRPIVKVLQNGDWVPVVVEPGLSDGRFVEIRKGLKGNETVQAKRDML